MKFDLLYLLYWFQWVFRPQRVLSPPLERENFLAPPMDKFLNTPLIILYSILSRLVIPYSILSNLCYPVLNPSSQIFVILYLILSNLSYPELNPTSQTFVLLKSILSNPLLSRTQSSPTLSSYTNLYWRFDARTNPRKLQNNTTLKQRFKNV